ncbi:MAG: aldehyde dehydrogenase family protein [Mahellales bacterium]|jgi:acyl-CoA reductase-like NAD-dependent aldehyde dehydrogenase
MKIDERQISNLVREVISRLNINDLDRYVNDTRGTSDNGVFEGIHDAITAARSAQKQLISLCLERRKKIIDAMRQAVLDNVDTIAVMAVEETGLGKVGDKVQKNKLAAIKTPGIEDISPTAYTGDYGFTLVERAPYGVIGAITPSTNPSETVICNGIGMIAAGNSVVFNPHPGAKKVTQYAIKLLNKAIVSAGGPQNLLTTVRESTMATGRVLMEHPDIRLLVVTGGPEIVKISMTSGKKVIAAGPGNPPVVVDETADIPRAAKDIVDGASFDNNVLCIAEKEVFVVDKVADSLKKFMMDNGAIELDKYQLGRLMEKITVKAQDGRVLVNKKYVGKDIGIILREIDLRVDSNIRLAIAEVEPEHPLVYLEQLMPVLPIVRVRDVDHGIAMAVKAEQGNGHTAMMHSTNVVNLSKMAKAIDTTIFVKNGPSYAGLGFLGEGFTTYTIASPTGEGLTSPITFTRQRRCVLKDQFRII